MKKFNTTGVCIPSKHYMVDISERVAEIREMVDEGKYFTINRARQYGKTTTIAALTQILSQDFYVVSMDFQDYGEDTFADTDSFCRDFLYGFCNTITGQNKIMSGELKAEIDRTSALSEDTDKRLRLFMMFGNLQKIWKSSDRPIVLIIDEVDSATNNQLFLDFLAGLRSHYLKREQDKDYKTFRSVILAGVTDVKHLKRKIRPDEESKVNSPWNIAADFTIDMSLSETGIKGMLDEYEADHHTGMDTGAIARMLREYTNGYPFLVSRLCQLIDEYLCKRMEPGRAWSAGGIDEAVKLLLAERNTLFDSLNTKLETYPELKASLRSILMNGTRLTYNAVQNEIAQLQMYGLVGKDDDNAVRITNRIFETMLYNLFLSEEELNSNVFYGRGDLEQSIFIEGGKLNVRLILEHFINAYHEICGELKDRFKEKDGREQFLLYLRPIINGTGNYYIEAQTRDQKRTDVIIDYLGERYVIELKIWHGERYNEKGEKQISEYLDYFGLSTGYMLSFNFNQKKETGVKRVEIGDKVLFEGTV